VLVITDWRNEVCSILCCHSMGWWY